MRRALVLVSALAMIVALPGIAASHPERAVTQPEDGTFPPYRHSGPTVVVCKPDSLDHVAGFPAPLRTRNRELFGQCVNPDDDVPGFRHIQQAVNWVEDNGQPGYRIKILPGVYREEPSRRSRAELSGAPIDQPELAEQCADIEGGAEQEAGTSTPALAYAAHKTCPHKQNLIAIHGDTTPDDDSSTCDGNLCDLQIEGTGVRPYDVIVDGKFDGFLNGVHADRAGGLYMKNMAFQHFEFNGLYIIESDGATVDDSVGSYNHEYGFLSFVSYVRYENCRGQANGDSAVYPGASPNDLAGGGLIPQHREEMEDAFTTEVRACRGHHNALGYSGTTGNAVFAHNNEFDHNSTGFSQDSLFPGHPGTPQNHALLEDNLFHENNTNYYDMTAHQGVCSNDLANRDYEDGAVCPAVPLPVGTAQITPGGNFNWFHANRFYDNWRTGTFQFWIPAEIREESPDQDAHFRQTCGPDGNQTCPFEETSHWNTYSANRLAENAQFGFTQPNGVDFTWDGEGQGNCWDQSGEDANTSAAGDVTYQILEDTTVPNAPVPFPDCGDSRSQTFEPASQPSAILPEAPCVTYDQSSQPDPTGCQWFHTPPVPADRQPANPTMERLAGADRIETAILASREGYPSAAPTVVLARSDMYPDALAGAPLAHARGGPLLLTPTDGLDPRVAEEINRLGASNAILLGGEGALSEEVVADLTELGLGEDSISRIGGASRFETAIEIAEALPATDAFLVKGSSGHAGGGDGWPDALAVSSVAALLERPILLTPPNKLADATADYLDKGAVEAVDIVGGPGAVAERVQTAAADRLDEVERVAGSGRLQTSLEVAKFALKAGADPTELWLATGNDWPDGVAAGSAAAVDEGLLLLVGDQVDGSPVATWLNDVHPYHDDESSDSVADVLERVRILGGSGAVPATVSDQLKSEFGAEEGDATGDRSHGTRVTTGRFEVLPTAGDAYENVTGYAVMKRRLDGTTRTRVYVQGLPTEPGTVHPVHAHAEPCSFRPIADNPHYQKEDGGPVAEPNEIHPRFATDEAGVGVGDSTVFHIAGQDVPSGDNAVSVMIHAPDGAKQACADLK